MSERSFSHRSAGSFVNFNFELQLNHQKNPTGLHQCWHQTCWINWKRHCNPKRPVPKRTDQKRNLRRNSRSVRGWSAPKNLPVTGPLPVSQGCKPKIKRGNHGSGTTKKLRSTRNLTQCISSTSNHNIWWTKTKNSWTIFWKNGQWGNCKWFKTS